MAIKARYAGKCPACLGGWIPGEWIEKRPWGWSHRGCVEKEEKQLPLFRRKLSDLIKPDVLSGHNHSV